MSDVNEYVALFQFKPPVILLSFILFFPIYFVHYIVPLNIWLDKNHYFSIGHLEIFAMLLCSNYVYYLEYIL